MKFASKEQFDEKRSTIGTHRNSDCPLKKMLSINRILMISLSVNFLVESVLFKIIRFVPPIKVFVSKFVILFYETNLN